MSFLIYGISDDLIVIEHEQTKDSNEPFYEKHHLNKEFDVFMKTPISIALKNRNGETFIIEADYTSEGKWSFDILNSPENFKYDKVKNIGEKSDLGEKFKTYSEIYRVESENSEIKEINHL